MVKTREPSSAQTARALSTGWRCPEKATKKHAQKGVTKKIRASVSHFMLGAGFARGVEERSSNTHLSKIQGERPRVGASMRYLQRKRASVK
jgi:hypothetical protein